MTTARLIASGIFAVVSLALVWFSHADRASAFGPNVTVAQWNGLCVTGVRWTYGIEDLVKQTLPNEWFDIWSPDALRAGASVIRQDYWYFHNHNDTGVPFCSGVAPYSYDMRSSRMVFIEGTGGVNSAKATDETVTKGWAPYGSANANDMYLSFGSNLQTDTQTQALHNYPWVPIVASASWPPGEWAPTACCPGGSGNIGVNTPLGSACLYDCTLDYDGDGVVNFYDNCPFAPNPSQTNTDAGNTPLNRPGADGLGDACDDNISGDGYTNAQHIALSKNPAVYCTIMRADVDGDAVVSVLDLSNVSSWFTTTIPPAPERYAQDADSVISILDLTSIAEVYLESVSACP